MPPSLECLEDGSASDVGLVLRPDPTPGDSDFDMAALEVGLLATAVDFLPSDFVEFGNDLISGSSGVFGMNYIKENVSALLT